MARLSPKIETLRALFAKSGNQCAFPGCDHALINKKNKFIAQVCHIEGANDGGERYNENSTDEERRDFDNLLILCYAHHIETNDIAEYTVEKLKKIKYTHEKSFSEDFTINEKELKRLTSEIEDYWNNLELLNKTKHIYLDSDLAVQIEIKDTFNEIISRSIRSIKFIQSHFDILESSDAALIDEISIFLQAKGINTDLTDIPQNYNHKNPLIHRNWETYNLAVPNIMQQFNIDLIHMEIKYLEEYLKNNSNDAIAIERFHEAKKQLNEYALNAMHYD